MKTEILLKSGKVSEYGFSCGYVEKIETEGLHKEIYKEHNIYHVRSIRNNTPELNTMFDGKTSHSFIVWMSYYKLTDARQLYDAIH